MSTTLSLIDHLISIFDEPYHIFIDPKALLQETTADQSILKALNSPNNPNAIKTVFRFISNHLEDKVPEISYLIQANLHFLHHYMSQISIQSANDVDHRRQFERSWLSVDTHVLMTKIINKYNDTQWMNKNGKRHAICIYYALSIIGHLCIGQEKSIINTILKQTDIIHILLEILNCKEHENNITFIERFFCIRLIRFFIYYGDNITDYLVDMVQKYNLNVMKLLMNECCNAFQIIFHKKLTKHQTMVLEEQKDSIPETMTISLRKPLNMTYIRSPLYNKNVESQSLHLLAYNCRIRSIGSLRYLAKHIRNPKLMDILCNEKYITSFDLKRLLQVTMMYMRQGKQQYPPQENTIDIISILIQNKSIAERIVCDDEILEYLIIGIRSRAHLSEFNSREIIVILYHIVYEYELLPRKYYQDLIFALNDIKETAWKNLSIYSDVFPCISLCTMIKKMLMKLFGIPIFRKIKEDEYICSICQNELDYPHTFKCGHSFCYGCCSNLIYSNVKCDGWYRNIHDEEPNKCPMCRAVVFGGFDRNDEQSAFILNKELLNQMNYEQIIIEDDDQKEMKFKGIENEYWKYLVIHHIDKLFDDEMVKYKSMRSEFVEFCEFMQVKTMNIENNERCISMANKSKKDGNQYFKEEQYENAILKYKESLKICPFNEYQLRSTYYSNISLCYVKLNDYFNAYRSSQKGLSMIGPYKNKVFVKLERNMMISLSESLKDNKMLNEYHKTIKCGSSNKLCPNRRLFDILLFQATWDFQYYHSQHLVYDSGVQTIENMQKIQKSDPLLLTIKEIEEGIDRYLPLNFDEYQNAEYILETKQTGKASKLTSNEMIPDLFAWEQKQ